jgi:hypothetical protein
MRFVISTGVALALATPASASCQHGPWFLFFGKDSPVAASADSGQACNLWFSDEYLRFDRFVVVQQPAHGHVSVTHYGIQAWVYTSNAGYKSPDVFIGAITGRDNISGSEGTSKIIVSVDVQ